MAIRTWLESQFPFYSIFHKTPAVPYHLPRSLLFTKQLNHCNHSFCSRPNKIKLKFRALRTPSGPFTNTFNYTIPSSIMRTTISYTHSTIIDRYNEGKVTSSATSTSPHIIPIATLFTGSIGTFAAIIFLRHPGPRVPIPEKWTFIFVPLNNNTKSSPPM